MKLSIFTEVNPLPKSKEEKHQASKKASKCQVVSFANDSDLLSAVSTYAWSPFTFHDNKRLADNFMSCDLLVYDIDEGMTIDQCEVIITKNNLCCLCLPSPSHTVEAPRFRVILPLSRTITSPEIYQETWKKGAELFGVVDEQCKDLARFFFKCTTDDGFWIEGSFFTPIIPPPVVVNYHTGTSQTMISVSEDIGALVTQVYGEKRDKIPEAVDYFIKNAGTGLPGSWVNSLNACCFSLALSGVEDDTIMNLMEHLAPKKLDTRDLYQIKRSIQDGRRAI